MVGPATLSHLILNDLERSKSRSLRGYSDFEAFYVSCKRAELDHMLLLNINRKAYMGSPLV